MKVNGEFQNKFISVASEYANKIKRDGESLLNSIDILSLPEEEKLGGGAVSVSNLSLDCFKVKLSKFNLSKKQINPEIIKYSSVGTKTDMKIFNPLNDLYNLKTSATEPLDVEYFSDVINFNELLNCCRDGLGKPSAEKINLVKGIAENKNAKSFTSVEQMLKACIIDKNPHIPNSGRYSEEFLKYTNDLLDYGVGDMSPFISGSIGKNGKINPELIKFSKEVLENSKISDASVGAEVFELCVKDNKIDKNAQKSIMNFLNNDKVKNADDCLDIFYMCKDEQHNFDSDLLEVAANALKRKEIDNPKSLALPMCILSAKVNAAGIDKKAALKKINDFISYTEITTPLDLFKGINNLDFPTLH